MVAKLKEYPIFQQGMTAAGISTQLATLTSAETTDADALNKATANLLIGLVTTKSFIPRWRNPDATKINQHGQIHPSLVIAVANYAKDNLAGLATLSDKELLSVGDQLKTACTSLNLSPNNKAAPLLAQTQAAFNTVKLPAIALARLQAKVALSSLSGKISLDGSNHSTLTRSSISSQRSDSSRGF